MFIQIQETPNPRTLKFLPQGEVVAEKIYEVVSEEMAARSPLAQSLWTLPGVEGILFGNDFISVTKDPETEWFSLKPLVMGVIMEHFVTHTPLFYETSEKIEDLQLSSDNKSENEEISQEIRELIDTRVRPAVAMDGGDIVFERFDQGIVYVSLKGACSGCPSSTATLKSGIETMLKHYIPEVTEVRPV